MTLWPCCEKAGDSDDDFQTFFIRFLTRLNGFGQGQAFLYVFSLAVQSNGGSEMMSTTISPDRLRGSPVPPRTPPIVSAFGDTDGEIFDRKKCWSKNFSAGKLFSQKEFWTKNFRPKKIEPKMFSVETIFGRKGFGRKLFRPKILVDKNCCRKVLLEKTFRSKNVPSHKFLSEKKKKIGRFDFRPTKFSIEKVFARAFFSAKIFFDRKIFRSKKLSAKKFSTKIFRQKKNRRLYRRRWNQREGALGGSGGGGGSLPRSVRL